MRSLYPLAQVPVAPPAFASTGEAAPRWRGGRFGRWLLLGLAATGFVAPAETDPSATRRLPLSRPLEYEVAQRATRATGRVVVAGALPEAVAVETLLEVRLTVGRTAGEWLPLVKVPAGTQTFRASVEAPAGGWHRLEVRARTGSTTVAETQVEHVGVGEIFVVAGQSNSANHGEERQTPASDLVVSFSGTAWQPARDPQPGASGNAGSFLPPFGDALAQRFQVPIGLVAAGVGATSVREWLPAGTRFPNPPTLVGNVTELPDGQWESRGTLFSNFVARLAPLGPRGFRAVLWHQGESDANQTDTTRTLSGPRYTEYLSLLIRASGRAWGWEPPWFVAQASYHTPDDPGSPPIRAAQAAVVQAGLALAGPDTDALGGAFRDGGGRGVHFSGAGLREHAARWVAKVAPWLEEQLAARAGAPATPASTDDSTKRRPSAWAFAPVQKPLRPGPGHPIDAFVDATLTTHGLARNPPASPRDLLRRVYFDLIGLPPSPEELVAFEADPSPAHYARVVEQLLGSVHYGERWGRHWLDVVRFTESQGFEYDRPRDNAWPYRDYVIRSFNDDVPYDRFMREQIAGDVLEPVTRDGILGAGLLVCGPWDQAGNSQANATQRAITREEEMEDLMSVVGQTFLGLTLNCARCHDHKFDPIPLAEYYRLKAVFDGVKHGERSIEGTADLQAREARREAARRELLFTESELTRLSSEGTRRALALRGSSSSTSPTVPVPEPLLAWSADSRKTPGLEWSLMDGAVMSTNGTLQLPAPGAYAVASPLTRDVREKTLEAWVTVADLNQAGGAPISLETPDGGAFDALVFGERQPRKWMAGSDGFSRTRDLDAPEETSAPGAWVQLVVVYSGERRVALYRNGEPYGAPYDAPGPLRTFAAGQARVVLGRRHQGGGRPWFTGAIRRAALYDRALSTNEIAAMYQVGSGGVSWAEALAQLTPAERDTFESLRKQATESRQRLTEAERPGPTAYVGRRDQPAPTRVLRRGDVKSPGDVVAPAALSAVTGLSPDFGLGADAPEAERRRKFADWLADPRNPLPARVMANRVWQYHFGQGLVATPSDFGANGARPTHPELLDWLAAELVERGWSLKALHRTIVTSATYQQASTLQTNAAAVDADNQWLWRYPPRRLEAEAVRDAMLAVSGQLNPAVGGPSFRPFTTSEYGATFYHLFDKADAEFNRRTVYRMNINSGKEPMLDAFDCPDPSIKTPRRGVTTTPLQALSLMNGSFVQRQAKHLAERAQRSLPDAPIEAAYRIALGRPPAAEEVRRAEEVVRARGLNHLCWALLNSTEFVYVR